LLYDSFRRPLSYLRVSVTDRCNLRCSYCMPADGVPDIPHDQVLSLEEIAGAVRVAVGLGFTKIRLTGGEPLVRKGIIDLVTMISSIDGIDDLAMTTNGILLPQFARPLKEAGLHRVNISLDTIDPERYRKITRTGNLEDVLAGIDAARQAGLDPIKLNVVLLRGEGKEYAEDVVAFGKAQGYEVRFIHQMNLETGEFSKVEGGDGGNCASCNRLRLSSRGIVHPCLFSDQGYSIRELGVEEAFRVAVEGKPEKGLVSKINSFYGIGG
jgi:GTP 3',8-cyclase